MKNKLSFVFLLTIFTVIFLNVGCGYEDGPKISFRSATKKLAKKWKLEQYIKDGDDYTAFFLGTHPKYVLEYRINNTYSITINDTNVFSYGMWHFKDGYKTIEREANSNTGTFYEHTILKFYNKELWTICDGEEFHFVKAE